MAMNGAYKDILVHLDHSSRSDVRLDVALELAARDGAHLVALYATRRQSLAMFMGDASVYDMRMADEILRQGREYEEEASRTIEKRFEETCRRCSVEAEFRCVQGFAAESVAKHAHYADLVIVGQNDPDHPAASGESDVPEIAILESGRPVLVVPYFGEIRPIGRTVLVGWKSGRESARAINDAFPLLSRANSVTVLTIDPEGGISGEGKEPASDICAHLARHGITATAAYALTAGVGEGDVLLNQVSDLGVDLLVAGGYGHSRAREFILGGATRSLLATMTVPVLFSH
jgi:nucleotide-binding universal stress UspA family protein